ncbi:MAG: hypothetical protein WAN26_09610 [Steroidobacteraceae bacterium]
MTGDRATLYFECLWMDVDSNAIGAHAFSSMDLARINGHWLVRALRATRALGPCTTGESNEG